MHRPGRRRTGGLAALLPALLLAALLGAGAAGSGAPAPVVDLRVTHGSR